MSKWLVFRRPVVKELWILVVASLSCWSVNCVTGAGEVSEDWVAERLFRAGAQRAASAVSSGRARSYPRAPFTGTTTCKLPFDEKPLTDVFCSL